MKTECFNISNYKKFYSEKSLMNFFSSKKSEVPFSRKILNLKPGEVALITSKKKQKFNLSDISNIPYVAAKKMGKKIIAKTIKLENGQIAVAVAVLNKKQKNQ
jgi:hypothetical protein